MFRIGDFSRIARVSARLLRFYDEIGLLAPAHADPDHVYRTPFYRGLRALIDWTVDHRWFVIAVMLAAFAGSILMFSSNG
mgnify:CR=1 FL=1